MYLGVFLNENLTWDADMSMDYIRCIRLYLLHMLKSINSEQVLITIYCSLLRSIVEFFSPFAKSLNANLCNKLNRLQKHAHNVISFYGCDCRIFDDLCQML